MCRFMDLIESFFPVVCCPICTGKFSSNVNFFIPVLHMPMNALSQVWNLSDRKDFKTIFSKMIRFLDQLWYYWSRINYFILIHLINILCSRNEINYELFWINFKLLLLNGMCIFFFNIWLVLFSDSFLILSAWKILF